MPMMYFSYSKRTVLNSTQYLMLLRVGDLPLKEDTKTDVLRYRAFYAKSSFYWPLNIVKYSYFKPENNKSATKLR